MPLLSFIELTRTRPALGQHSFELRGSNYTWILFSFFSFCFLMFFFFNSFLFIEFIRVTLINAITGFGRTVPQHVICTLSRVFTTPSQSPPIWLIPPVGPPVPQQPTWIFFSNYLYLGVGGRRGLTIWIARPYLTQHTWSSPDFAILKGYYSQCPTDTEGQLKFLGDRKLYVDFWVHHPPYSRVSCTLITYNSMGRSWK